MSKWTWRENERTEYWTLWSLTTKHLSLRKQPTNHNNQNMNVMKTSSWRHFFKLGDLVSFWFRYLIEMIINVLNTDSLNKPNFISMVLNHKLQFVLENFYKLYWCDVLWPETLELGEETFQKPWSGEKKKHQEEPQRKNLSLQDGQTWHRRHMYRTQQHDHEKA